MEFARDAYNSAIAPHHALYIIVLANIAIRFGPNRKSVINSVLKEQTRMRGQEYTEQQFYNELEILVNLCTLAHAKVLNYVQIHGYDKLILSELD